MKKFSTFILLKCWKIKLFLHFRLQTENFTNQLAKETSNQLKELNAYVRQISVNNPTSEDVSLFFMQFSYFFHLWIAAVFNLKAVFTIKNDYFEVIFINIAAK